LFRHNIFGLKSRFDVTFSNIPLFGSLEGGGTKFVYVVGTGPDDIHAEIRFPTTSSEETMGRAIDFFKQQETVL
jgi:fructokinase